MSAAGNELSGWCAHHRTIVTWRTRPTLSNACCPIDGCGLPLMRRPNARSIGRHAIVYQQPITRERPQLVVKPVEKSNDGQA